MLFNLHFPPQVLCNGLELVANIMRSPSFGSADFNLAILINEVQHVTGSTASAVCANRCNGKATCFHHKGLSSAGTGKQSFKIPLWNFCGDTLVKMIKATPLQRQ